MLKFITGPISSKPGPILPRVQATALAVTTGPKSSNEMKMIPIKKSRKYRKRKLEIFETVAAGTGFPSNLTGTTALGCNLRNISRPTNLKAIRMRITLIEPAVDAEQPPMNIMINKSILLKVGQRSKFAEA